MSESIQAIDQAFVAHTYGRFPVTLVSGYGATLIDESGKSYVDLGSGIAVNGLGVCNDAWRDAVVAQLFALPHTSNLYYTEPCAKLAQMLCARTGMKKVFFGNSGAEANECALKVARKYAHDRYGEGRSTILTLKNSFHGRTIATLAATGQDAFHTDFFPFPEGFAYAEPNDLPGLTRLTETLDCAAVLVEIVQGEGGVEALSADFLRGVESLCRTKDMLFMVDEVQTGNGRCGTLYAYMAYGLSPDVVTTAKGLGGGLPIGVCLLGDKAQDVLTPGKHGSTFGGNPVACAGACAILNQLDDALLASVSEKSAYIRRELEACPGVKRVSGLGFMLGVETEKDAKAVVLSCLEKGVLVLTAKNKVRLLPPLTIAWDELVSAITRLKEAIQS